MLYLEEFLIRESGFSIFPGCEGIKGSCVGQDIWELCGGFLIFSKGPDFLGRSRWFSA